MLGEGHLWEVFRKSIMDKDKIVMQLKLIVFYIDKTWHTFGAILFDTDRKTHKWTFFLIKQ